MLRFDAYGFLHLLVFNHPFHITCMKDMVSFHMYVMANLKHDLFLCHVLAAHYGHCDDNQLWPANVLPIPREGVYDGIGKNVCHEESFLQFALLPTSAKVVCSVSPQDIWIATLPIVYSNL